jgi:hypothetical protein
MNLIRTSLGGGRTQPNRPKGTLLYIVKISLANPRDRFYLLFFYFFLEVYYMKRNSIRLHLSILSIFYSIIVHSVGRGFFLHVPSVDTMRYNIPVLSIAHNRFPCKLLWQSLLPG